VLNSVLSKTTRAETYKSDVNSIAVEFTSSDLSERNSKFIVQIKY
jgi:hypothetical protein